MSHVRSAAPTYDAAYIGCAPCNEDAHISLAFQWAWGLAYENGCAVTAITPTREQFRTHPALQHLPRGTTGETPRTMHAPGRDTRSELNKTHSIGIK
jgi:hypothetical protein